MIMQNLSHLLAPNPVAPTSQHQGGQASNAGAMSGPGTGPDPVSPVPVLHAIDHGRPTTTHPEGTPETAFTNVTGRPWVQVSPDESSPGSEPGNATQGGRWAQS